jgi:hypothetical protein
MDIVRSQCTNVSYGKLGSIIDNVNPQKFIPLQCIESIRRSTQEYHYWLKHDTTNNGLLVAIDKKNELNHLFKHFFNSKNTLEFKGKLFTKNREDFEYYTIKNWELTNV